jgi:PadR family transcriptional regulator, regulatory protein PadR
MAKTADLLPGTLDLLILKSVSLGPLHGYGILLRIQQTSRDVLQIEQGSLYPALYRLERQRMIVAEWGTTENNRQAKYYSLTAAGTRHLQQETQQWRRFANAMSNVLETLPDEV